MVIMFWSNPTKYRTSIDSQLLSSYCIREYFLLLLKESEFVITFWNEE